MKQHIKPEDRSPALRRYYELKGTPEGDANAARQRQNDKRRRSDPKMKKKLAADTKDWYDNRGGKEVRNSQYTKTRDDGTRKKRRDDRRVVLIEHMGGKCERCGIINPPNGFHFDHIDPMTKSHNINPQDSYEKSFKELKKCQLLCFDCHLDKTWKEDLPIILEKKYGGKK